MEPDNINYNSDMDELFAKIAETFRQAGVDDINQGDCYNWAAVVHKATPGCILCTIPRWNGRAFVKIDGLFYDSDTLHGVVRWQDLTSWRFAGRQASKEVPSARDSILEVQTEEEFYRWHRVNRQYIKKLIKIGR